MGFSLVLRSGCSWRMLPHDLPPWGTVHYYYRRLRRAGVWEKIHESLYKKVRKASGKPSGPTQAIGDSQSVKTTKKGGPERGYDGAKKVNGRKRHILVDSNGLLLKALVHAADISEKEGATTLFEQVAKNIKETTKSVFSSIRNLFLDAGYQGKEWLEKIKGLLGWNIEVVHKPRRRIWCHKDCDPPAMPRFTIVKKRWVVERTFSWLDGYRRLSKDYEFLPRSSESMIHLAMIRLMLNRLSLC